MGGIDYIARLFALDPNTIRRGQLEPHLLDLLADFTAGDPMREGVLWTNLSCNEISRRLGEKATPVSPNTVRKLLKKYRLAD